MARLKSELTNKNQRRTLLPSQKKSIDEKSITNKAFVCLNNSEVLNECLRNNHW